MTGRTDVSADGLRKLVQALEEQRESLELDEAGAQARKAALEDALKAAAQNTIKSVDGDAAVKELRAVVDMREAQLSRMTKLNDTGAATQGDKEAARG